MIKKRSIEDSAFLVGYQDGLRTRKHISRRQAQIMLNGLTDAAIDAYLNGRDDGVNRDNFRAVLIQHGTELRAPY